MAMNNYFPMGYQPVIPNYQQQFQNVPQAQNSAQNGIIWVQGLEGAKAFPVGAGNNVLLMDSEEAMFYIKSVDPSGMPMPLRVFEYSEKKEGQTAKAVEADYITRDELADILKDYSKKKTTKEVKKDGE